MIGEREDVRELAAAGGPGRALPVYVGAWMSPRIELLAECTGMSPPAVPYDPEENLRVLQRAYPGSGLYYSMLSFKKDWTGLARPQQVA